MKRALFLTAFLLPGLLPLTLAQALGREAGLRVELVTTFDYPDSQVIFTQPTAINEAGDIVGYAVTNDLVYFGFVRYADGSFSDPIVEPSDGDNFTVATGITDDGMICGYFRDGATREHGYFLSNGTFTQYDVPGATKTLLFGINDAGDVIGDAYGPSLFPFIAVGGIIQTIRIRDPHNSDYVFPGGINNLGEFSGYYLAPSFLPAYGFFGQADEKIRDHIAPSNATQTYFYGLNDDGTVVGSAATANDGHSQGLVARLPNRYVFFAYPRAITTELTGINNGGLICGAYKDNIPHIHGIIAQLTANSAE